MEGEFLEIHRSKLELDPCGDRGQPSIRSITHCVFLFCVRKDALNRLRTQGVGCLTYRRMPYVFCPLQIFLPDMTGYGFRVLPVLRAFLQFWAIPANIAFALIFPISFTVGSGITENLVLRAQDTIVIFIIYVRIPGQIPFLRHRPFVGKRWDFSTIEDLFANPWRFVPCIRCNDLYFRIMCLQALKYRIEYYVVMNVTWRNFRLQYIAPSVAYGMRLIRKAFLVLSLVEHSAFRVSGGFCHHFFLPRRTRSVIVIFLLQRFLSMCCAIRFDLLIQLLLIAFRCNRYGLFHLLFQVRIRFDMRSIHKHDFRRQVSCPGNFLQYPPEHTFDYFGCKSMPECVADGCKVRQLLRHGVPQKPSIGHIHFRIPHGLPQRTDAKQMLDQHQLKQNHRITAGPSVILAVQVFYQFVYARKIHRCVDLPQQVSLGYQHICAQHFYRLALLRFFL